MADTRRSAPRRPRPDSGIDADFVKIDLHIHTPASHCYEGPRNDREYLNILKRAKSLGLKIIAITDHNSIQGYERLLQIKTELLSERKTLSSITDSRQTHARLASIEKDLALFDGILVLPGVEFEVNNGIHLLVIFSDSVTPVAVKKFIVDGGYDPHAFGKEAPPCLSKWDIFALYEQSKKYDCMIIDAHTDSDKGIYKTILAGATRAACFTSPQLCAIGYNNETQKDKLKSILDTALEYKRTAPLTFVKFSDAHCSDQVGRQLTWVKLTEITFAALKSVFSNSSENVSTERPSIDLILTRLLKEGTTLRVPDLSSENCQLFTKMVCAVHNSGGGHVVVGVNERGNRLGVACGPTDGQKRVDVLLRPLSDCFKSISGKLSPHTAITIYQLQNERAILSVYVPGSGDLVSSRNDNLTYCLKGNKIVVLSATETQNLVEERTAHAIETRIGDRIAAIEKDCGLVRSFFDSLPVVRRFEHNSLATALVPEIARRISLDPQQMAKAQRLPENGRSRGNTAHFPTVPWSPRLPDAYLRYSAPLVNISRTASAPAKTETLYIVPGGAAFYSDRDYPLYAHSETPILKIHPKMDNAPYGLKFTACFLKSSFLLWYCLTVFGEMDIFEPQVFNNIHLPRLDIKHEETRKHLDTIDGNFRAILGLERAFLRTSSSIENEGYEPVVRDHNAKVSLLAYAMDHAIYGLLGLSQDEVHTIESSLRLSGVFLPLPAEAAESSS